MTPTPTVSRIQPPSRTRLQAMLTAYVLIVPALLTVLTIATVTVVFGHMEAALHQDLSWKSRVAAAELVDASEIGLALRDPVVVGAALDDFRDDGDILGVEFRDADDHVVLDYGDPIPDGFEGPSHAVRETPDALVTWVAGNIEGEPVGRVSVAISKERLAAGDELKSEALSVSAIGCLVAALGSLVFVRFYLGPLLTLTERAIEQLRELNATLEARVAERTEALQRSRDELADSLVAVQNMQQQVAEASRKAGMAEVATSVVHNIGNVLNSINVSASTVHESLRSLKIGGVGKTAALLVQHESDLASFMASDPRGRALPGYLRSLDSMLEGERTRLVAEIESLQTHIDHVKAIVAMQQTHARSAVGVYDTLDVDALIGDALTMNLASNDRGGVVVEHRKSHLVVTVDRHKVFQILLNILGNARHAIRDARSEGGRILIESAAIGTKDYAIRITDDGVGIAPEHLQKIFTHGFTTRKDGHGFGLHGSANAAREMGGRLEARSDGQGHGATFVLELPVRPVGANSKSAVHPRSYPPELAPRPGSMP